MQQFADLPYYQQALLLVRVVQIVTDGDRYIPIEEIATRRNTSPKALWLQICADEGFDGCAPWHGFPDLPEDFSIHRIGSPEHPLITKSLAKLTSLQPEQGQLRP